MDPKISHILLKLEEQNIDGILVSHPANITYLVKYPSRDSYLLITRRKNIYLTDSRYFEEAKGLISEDRAQIKQVNGFVFKEIAQNCLDLGVKRIAFEERYLPFAEYKKIKDFLKGKAELVPMHSLIEGLREVKEPDELLKMRKAIQITAEALKFIRKELKPGMKEVEVAAELERFMIYRGASGASFKTIVGSGPNSSFPHHISSGRRITENDAVLIDLGVEYLGYKSDLTRVLFLGKIKTLWQQVYDTVRTAKELAIKRIRSGIKISEVDAQARDYIARQGFGEYFGHSLGHGVGLEVHENPHISKRDDSLLQEGMVFTVEPGIYLPGKFGVRLEDMVLVTDKGCEVLSGSVNQ